MRITFLRDEIYETEGPGKGPAFPAGSTWDCADDFGDRWLRRAAAERIGNQVPRDGARFVEVTRGRGAGAEAAAEKAAAEKAAAEKAAAEKAAAEKAAAEKAAAEKAAAEKAAAEKA